MLRNWAENNGLAMVIELDHLDGPLEFEEYVVLVPQGGRHGLITLWRARQAVMITPLGSNTRRYVSMAHALSAMHVRNGMIDMRQDRISGF